MRLKGPGKGEARRRSQAAGFNAHLVKHVNLEDIQVLLHQPDPTMPDRGPSEPIARSLGAARPPRPDPWRSRPAGCRPTAGPPGREDELRPGGLSLCRGYAEGVRETSSSLVEAWFPPRLVSRIEAVPLGSR